MANSFLASFEVNSIGERIGGIDGEIFENWRGRGGLHAATDRTMADNRIASDFCMPISWPVLCRRQCANNYAKRRPFIRPFGRIQTAFPYPLSSRGANNRSDARRFHVFLPFFFFPFFLCPPKLRNVLQVASIISMIADSSGANEISEKILLLVSWIRKKEREDDINSWVFIIFEKNKIVQKN